MFAGHAVPVRARVPEAARRREMGERGVQGRPRQAQGTGNSFVPRI